MIGRTAGTVVLLGMLCGVISGCGTSVDPRLQPDANLRASCTYKGNTYTDEKIRGILADIESHRLGGATKANELYGDITTCAENPVEDDKTLCSNCVSACIDKVYGPS